MRGLRTRHADLVGFHVLAGQDRKGWMALIHGSWKLGALTAAQIRLGLLHLVKWQSERPVKHLKVMVVIGLESILAV